MVARSDERSCSLATGLPGPSTSPGSMARSAMTPAAGAAISERVKRSAPTRRALRRASGSLRRRSAPVRGSLRARRGGAPRSCSMRAASRSASASSRAARSRSEPTRASNCPRSTRFPLVKEDFLDGAPSSAETSTSARGLQPPGDLEDIGQGTRDDRGATATTVRVSAASAPVSSAAKPLSSPQPAAPSTAKSPGTGEKSRRGPGGGRAGAGGDGWVFSGSWRQSPLLLRVLFRSRGVRSAARRGAGGNIGDDRMGSVRR